MSSGEEAVSIDQWAASLGSGDPSVRQQAEEQLAARGAEAEASILELSKDSNPWVAARATRLLMALRGIDPRLPLQLQKDVFQFSDLKDEEQVRLLESLTRQAPGHLNSLVLIYSRITNEKALSAGAELQWAQRFNRSAAANQEDVDALDVRNLSPAMLGYILSGMRDVRSDETIALYKKWRELVPSIGEYLKNAQASLEVDYLLANARPEDLLAYLPKITDDNSRQMAARMAATALSKWQPKNIEELSEDVALGYLILMMSRGRDAVAMPFYKKYLAAHEGLAKRLPSDVIQLEVSRLLSSGDVVEAMKLALAQKPDADQRNILRYELLQEFSKAMGADPTNLPNGLPAISDPEALLRMSNLLSVWFPMSRPSMGYSDIDEKVACFDRWAKSDDWLQAAREHGPVPLYHLVMARRGKLGEAVLLHEFEKEADSLKSLGALILMRNEIAKGIPDDQCSVETLRHLLDGAMTSIGIDKSTIEPVLALAAAWEVRYPDLLADGSFSTQALYSAAKLWKKDQFKESALALLSYTKSVKVDYPHGSNRDSREIPNPLARNAGYLLADLMAMNSSVDVNALLPPAETSEETLQNIYSRLNSSEKPDSGRIRSAITIAKLLRQRFDNKDAKPLISSHDARDFARDAWIAGEATLAGDFLIEGFLSNPDISGDYDSNFVPAIVLLGRGEEALAGLNELKENFILTEAVRNSKKARLLLELGKKKEALDLDFGNEGGELRLRMAIEAQAWDNAISATHWVNEDGKRREAMRAAIAILSEKSELTNRHYFRDEPVLALLNGQAMRDDDLSEMARDAELSARLEAKLTGAIASGEPAPAMVMSEYLQHLDLLPDRARAIRITVDLAKSESCTVFGRPDALRGKSMHKVIAAEALMLLGHGDLAFAAMRPLMEESVQPHDFKHVRVGTTGGYTRVVVSGYQQATRIAHLEWPEDKPAQRMERLAAILGQEKAEDRGREMLALIIKHHGSLDNTELLQALQLVFLDLANAGKVPDEFKKTTGDLLRERKASAAELKWLESQWVSNHWTGETTHPPLKGKTRIQASFTPKPGAKTDPHAGDFVLIDGLAEVSKLNKKGEADKADGLLKGIVIRLLLDRNLYRQEVRWKVVKNSSARTFSSSGGTRGFTTVLRYLALMDLPAEMASAYVDACANPWTNYSDSERLLYAARTLVKAGKFSEALAYYQRYLIVTVPPIGSEDIGLSGREEMAEMQRVRGLVCVKENDSAGVQSSVLRLLQLAPYEPKLAADISAALKKKGDSASLKAARGLVDGYWQARLLELPDSETYKYWKERWCALFP